MAGEIAIGAHLGLVYSPTLEGTYGESKFIKLLGLVIYIPSH